ncbi:hypothetical protein [Leptospirillum ferriphilum]|jgi:hypothetical protein|uniref:Uncharacterized protein n=2 Tax=Leptospirillum ferriphilum TaxID=178606 RepID=A0A059XYK5_9BACT|nr:hypothetical protein [Leptospirillum ferriphilum]AFS54478.1 hypothetical protein LFML04_2288 [Leptospirillum ferriphilum ML-04]AIA32003.1 hypothetical protein Y981_11890 [Leptospirillum ferriphilum YSK]EAY58244.1 MAG: protein of unknown function [Leptospirillum rubarum]
MKNWSVWIDGKQVDVDGISEEIPLSGRLREIIDRDLPLDRIVEEIRLDGEIVCKDGEYVHDLDDKKGTSLELVTVPLEDILRESVRTLVSHLSQVARLFSEIGRSLRKGKIDEVFGGEGAYKDRGGAYVQGIESMVAAQVLVGQIRGACREEGARESLVLIEDESRFEELLGSMLVAQEAQDWILLADLIEYELVPVFEKGLSSAEQYYQSVFAGAA